VAGFEGPGRLHQGEAFEVEEGDATGEALGDRPEHAPLLGAGEHVLAPGPVPIDTPLERREELGGVLDLVEDERSPVAVEEQLGIPPRILDVDDGVEDDDVGFSLEEVREERALPDLPGARDDHGGEARQELPET
jgi:hypothetical protein